MEKVFESGCLTHIVKITVIDSVSNNVKFGHNLFLSCGQKSVDATNHYIFLEICVKLRHKLVL